MKKKLMVAAVAGALAAPAVALAQASSVQMYGLFNVEYAPYVANGDNAAGASRVKTDEINSGASRIGFRGSEKLGGGLTTWFQCETDVRFLNGSAGSGTWCDRNSALGIRGSWGNFFIGSWDSPAKRVTSATRMLNETGWLGAQRLLMTFSGYNYSARNGNSINYDSPRMNGFSFSGQYTTENPARNATDIGQAHYQWRDLGANVFYRSGPLVVGVGWAELQNQGSFQTGAGLQPIGGRDDTVYVVGANYTFGNFKVGGVWTSIEAERGLAPTPARERDSYNLALDWRLGGPGTVRFGWTHAGETDTGVAACANCGSATQYQISYIHRFSKRTTGALGWVMLDNGTGGAYNLQGLSTNIRSGEKSQALATQWTHSF